jgi:hypothetical protein
MVFFVAAQEVGLRLDMLRLLYFSSLSFWSLQSELKIHGDSLALP